MNPYLPLALVAVALAAGPPARSSDPTGTIGGTVKDAGTSRAIPGGVIQISVYTGRPPVLVPVLIDKPTGPTGGFMLDVPAGQALTIVFFYPKPPPKYTTGIHTITVEDGKTSTFDPALETIPPDDQWTKEGVQRQATVTGVLAWSEVAAKRPRADVLEKFGPYLEYLSDRNHRTPGGPSSAALGLAADALRGTPLAVGPGTGPDAAFFARGDEGELVRLDGETGKPLWDTPKADRGFSGLAALPDGSVAELKFGVVRVWDGGRQKSDKPAAELAHAKGGTPVAVAAAADRLAVADVSGLVVVYTRRRAEFVQNFDLQTEGMFVRGLAFSPEGSHLAVVGLTGGIEVRDARTGRSVSRVPPDRESAFVNAIAYSPNGRRLVTSGGLSKGGAVRAFDVDSGKSIWTARLPDAAGGASGVAVTANGTVITTGSRSGGVYAFDVETGRELTTAPGLAVRGSVALGPGGKSVGFVDTNGRPQLIPVDKMVRP